MKKVKGKFKERKEERMKRKI